MAFSSKAVVALFLLVGALAVGIAALSIERWFEEHDEEATPPRWYLSAGVKTYSFETASGRVTTGKLSDPGPEINRDFSIRLDEGGTRVIIAGSLGLVACAVALVIGFLAFSGAKLSYKRIAAFLAFAAAALIAIGAVMYARVLYAFYSFIILIVSACCMLFAALLLSGSLMGKRQARKTQVSGAVLLLVGVGVACAAMATEGWVRDDRADASCAWRVLSIGLKTYTHEGNCLGVDFSVSGTLKGVADETGAAQQWKLYAARLDEGGDYVLGLGIVGTIAGAAAFVTLILAISRKESRYQLGSVILSIFGGAFIVIAVVLYARKLFIGASFIMFVATAFLCAISFVTFLITSVNPGLAKTGDEDDFDTPIAIKTDDLDAGLVAP